MILLDPEGQQHGKLTSYVAGPTVRLPDRVAGRSSILLPDYETSQAQHNSPSSPDSSPTSSTVSFRKYSLHNTVDSRFWRATLYALAIYIALSVTIGVPLIVTKLTHKHKSGPPPWVQGSDDAALASPLVMMNSGLFAMSSSIRCNTWNYTRMGDDGLLYSMASYPLHPSGSFSIRSSAWNTLNNSDVQISGDLTVDINPDPSVTTAVFYLTTVSSSQQIRDECQICFSPEDDDGDSRGIPTNLTASQSLSFNITLLFPQSSSQLQLDNLVSFLPNFTQNIGPISPRVTFDSLILEGMQMGINSDSVWANTISVTNLLGPITGTFNATQSLKLDTINAPISANLIVVQGPGRQGPTFFSLDTGESEINANVVLLAPPSTNPHINFIGHIRNFDGSIRLNVSHDPSTPPAPLDLRIQNSQAPCNVSLDSKFSGNYDLASKLSSAYVSLASNLDDYSSSGSRQIQPEIDTISSKRGWVGFGSKPSYYDPHTQGTFFDCLLGYWDT
ncbi:hypothetical protein BT96DRAFT_804006 [Gymnopus androsaceus JB14]|uniref:Uncharacterized protein n=1 Tax=Gymnopus androsaceus JB14 TaxID=1447944 RepID=A0A6A4IFZ0_9AGAR|nr:hypothetical protein BT96DRAFT_804006 [Gymnopus androsaceus JB14]